MFFIVGIVLCALATLYYYLKSFHSVFSKENIPSSKPTFFFGNLFEVTLGWRNFGEVITDVYNEFVNYKYVGFYKFLTPSVVIRDPEIVGNVLVKDFSSFEDNDIIVDENVDYLMARNLFTMKGHHWKYSKTLLTPMFTSGKLKYIFPLLETISQQMVQYVKSEIAGKRGNCIEGKQIFVKYTTNNVATAAFGLDAKAFEGDTEFVKVANNFAEQSYINNLKFLLIFVFPWCQKYIKVKFMKDSVEQYLTNVVTETIRYRKENNIVRNDFLDQITQLKEKSTEYPFGDRDVVAQGAGFFLDGVETSSSVMNYMLYELARHPEIQQKVREEINKVLGNSTLTYEKLSEMTYLDCVLNESLRLNSAVFSLFKVCTHDYTLPAISDKCSASLKLRKGDSVFVPVYAIHTDPQYYPEPKKFNPDRFSDENKASIQKNTFFPFGAGPRACLGMRFGIMQVKIGILALVRNFEIKLNDKSLPYEISPLSFLLTPKKGFWFDFKPLHN